MLKLALSAWFAAWLALPAAAQRVVALDFEREPEETHLVDLDGDGDLDVLAFLPDDAEGKPFLVARRGPDGFDLEPGAHLPKDTVAIALGAFVARGRLAIAALTTAGVVLHSDSAQGVWSRSAPLSLGDEPLLRAAHAGAPWLWHWPLDLDRDGRDDLHFPVESGLAIFFGSGEGAFGEPRIAVLPRERRASAAPSALVAVVDRRPRPVLRDLDGDGLRDLVWYGRGALGWRPQTAPRTFLEGAPRVFDLAWLDAGETEGVERRDLEFVDLKGPRPGLLVSRALGDRRRLAEMTTSLLLLEAGDEKDLLSRRPLAAVVTKGLVGIGPHLVDADGDGDLDLLVGTFGAGLGDMVTRFLGRVPVTFLVYPGSPDGGISGSPVASRRVDLDADDFSSGGARRAGALHEDLDGDGLLDLVRVVRDGERHRHELLPGRRGENGFDWAEEPAWSVVVEQATGLSIRDTRRGRPGLVVTRRRGLTLIEAED